MHGWLPPRRLLPAWLGLGLEKAWALAQVQEWGLGLVLEQVWVRVQQVQTGMEHCPFSVVVVVVQAHETSVRAAQPLPKVQWAWGW